MAKASKGQETRRLTPARKSKVQEKKSAKVEKPKPPKRTKGAKSTETKASQSSKVYEIDKITSHKLYNGQFVKYAVTWVGYKNEKTWMTELELDDAPDALADYKFKVTGQHYENDGKSYVIQEILGHRDVGNSRYYLVHWKGYDNPVDHSEMLEEDLSEATAVLNAYKSKLSSKIGNDKKPAIQKKKNIKKKSPKA
ncbi:unnamed protein product [Caenorhabditis angaria]|uniref:Chromo domain-containing protein n=1 Tax=Caenorhabditis angaria TaxID=860376 RepID=A0A9P1MSW7_9PELO|nr:unnamed protein product [Caenorhabditis angaria]